MIAAKQGVGARREGGKPTQGRRLGSILERVRREIRERWEWYKLQQREDRVRHWWDVYTR